jgi:hypothetical protein
MKGHPRYSRYCDPSTAEFRKFYHEHLIDGVQAAAGFYHLGTEHRADATQQALGHVVLFLRDCGFSSAELRPLRDLEDDLRDAETKRKSGRAPKLKAAEKFERVKRAALLTSLVSRRVSPEKAKKQISLFYELTSNELKKLITFGDNVRKGNFGPLYKEIYEFALHKLDRGDDFHTIVDRNDLSPRQCELAKQFGWVK